MRNTTPSSGWVASSADALVRSTEMAVRAHTRRFGRLYRGREGQWAWVAHRVTGVIIILFLFAHVVDTAVVGWGPAAYNKVIAVYRNPVVGVLELILVACVIFHALNGVRIMLIDFWPKAAVWHKQLLYGTL